jgi:signal transduction histidine kinase
VDSYETPGFEDGSELYVLSRPLVVGEGDGARRLMLTVALDHADVEAQSAAFLRDVVTTLGLIALVLVVGAWVQINRGLAPLSTLRGALRDIREGRMPRLGKGYASEVQPLADELDRLLDRRDALVAKARDRAGALAHGLKTPLTVMSLEARRLSASGRADAAAVLDEQITAMRGHVERELARSRARGPEDGLAGGRSSDLGKVCDDIVRVMRRMPYADQLSFDVEVPAGIRVGMDPHDLSEVLGNLVDNSRKWARTRITIRAVRSGGAVTVTVADDGPGLAATPTADRQADGDGIGLGIVADVLGEYDTVLEQARENGRTVMRFALPVAPAEPLGLAAE